MAWWAASNPDLAGGEGQHLGPRRAKVAVRTRPLCQKSKSPVIHRITGLFRMAGR